MSKTIFSAYQGYKNNISKYNAKDGRIALIFYLCFLAAYLLLGILYRYFGFYAGVYVNLSLLVACIVIVLARGQKLSSIGLTFKYFAKSALLGLVCGTVVLIINTVTALIAGAKLISFGEVFYNIYYYFIIIALVEEVVFRGYLQTRLYGLIKSDILAVFLGGVMFAVMHIPFQIFNQGLGIFSFLGNNYLWLLLLIFWHTVINFLYRRYNTLTAPVIFHGLMNLSENLFVL